MTGNKAGIYLALSGSAIIPPKRYLTRNLRVENNILGNTHTDNLVAKGKGEGCTCDGFQRTGISIDLTSAGKPELANLVISGNHFMNIPYGVYSGTPVQSLEGLNPGAHLIPEVIVGNERTLKGRQMFGGEVIRYPDGRRWKCKGAGFFTDLKGIVSGAAGSNTLTCVDCRGLRVGMFITVSGGGKGGAPLSAYITAIHGKALTIDGTLVTPVNGAPFSISRPVVEQLS
jgi:hypothetical protein